MHALLEPFATHGVSMTRFESRPARTGLWEYLFFVDSRGHRDDPPVAAALAELRAQARHSSSCWARIRPRSTRIAVSARRRTA